jgi:hypothetical protein
MKIENSAGGGFSALLTKRGNSDLRLEITWGYRGKLVPQERFGLQPHDPFCFALPEIRQPDHFAASHGGFVCADSCAGPVDGRVHVRKGRTPVHDARHEFVHQVRMRATVPPTLDEGKVRVPAVIL